MNAISEFLSKDHDRIDALADALRRETQPARTAPCFQHFDHALRAHMAWEEDLLFPLFEERTGMRFAGPTAVMRAEHEQIRGHLQHLAAAADPPAVGAALDALAAVLAPHNLKEEQVLYPWFDRVLDAAEKSDLLERMRSASSEDPAGSGS